MGMVLGYIRVSPRNVAALRAFPELLRPFLDGDDVANPPATPPAPASASGWLSRLFASTVPAPSPNTLALEPREPDDRGDTDKAWHAIHYLLTGSASGGECPADFILAGGTPVGDEDVGYGPARLFTPSETRDVESVVSRLNREIFQRRYNGPAMDAADVYPQIWSQTGDDVFEYAWEHFRALQGFLRDTVERHHGLLLILT